MSSFAATIPLFFLMLNIRYFRPNFGTLSLSASTINTGWELRPRSSNMEYFTCGDKVPGLQVTDLSLKAWNITDERIR